MNVTSACRDIKELSPQAKTACDMFMEECERRGINIFITETYRSRERQAYLYAQGRTRPGNKVTWTMNSRHISRRAWDIACGRPNSLYDVNVLAKAGEVAKGLGITWGGIWSPPDRPHFEIPTDWQEKKGVDDLTEAETRKIIREEIKKAMQGSGVVSDWARKEWVDGVAKGITDGNRPTAVATREEVVAMMLRK